MIVLGKSRVRNLGQGNNAGPHGLVGIDDTMSILYARMGAEMMEQIINELFYDSNSCSDDGASSSNQGRGHSGKLDFVSFHKAWSKVLLGDRAE